MHKYLTLFLLLFLLGIPPVFAQGKTEALLIPKDTLKSEDINPLAPAKAAFYSAILPGLGQAYNKKYWKIPLVYGAMGTSIYFYVDNNKNYHRFRDAYKQRLAGLTDEYKGQYSTETLINAQRTFQRNRDLSLLITAAFYVLNIVDANVDAHLGQFNVNDNLTLSPKFDSTDLNYKPKLSLALNYTF